MYRYSLMICICLALCGCTPKQAPFKPYHSTASIPVGVSIVHSDLTYVSPDTSRVLLKVYGVFAGVDNATNSYVLIAPRRFESIRSTDNPFEYYDIENAATVPGDKLDELLVFLDSCAGAWSEERTLVEATYLNYRLTPEHDMEQVSSNVVVTRPSLEILFQMNTKGPLAYIWVGEDHARRALRIRGANAIVTLRNTIERARKTVGLDAKDEESDLGNRT